jgi:hypothetical protein
MHDILGYLKVCARGEPKFLTEQHKHNCLDMSSHHLEWYHNEGEMKWSQRFAKNGQEDCCRALCHCTSMPALILLPIPRKPFRKWNLKLSTTHLTVQILLLPIFICRDFWRRLWKVAYLQMTKQRKWCMTASTLNQKTSSDGIRKLMDQWSKCRV